MKRFAYDFEKPLVKLADEAARARAEGRAGEAEELERRLVDELASVRRALTPWQEVLLARHPNRPRGGEFVEHLFTEFTPVEPDRRGHRDPAVVTGFGRLGGRLVAICAVDRGRDARESARRNFGMVHPEGYRAFVRLLDAAERFGAPVVTIVDTPGAHPGPEAEEGGQAWAIAEAIEAMLWVRVPTVAVLVGEGGSGGALALACSDRRLVLEHAYFSVISPEGCASILWRDESKAPEAAACLRLTSRDLLAHGFVDEVVKEPPLAAHWDPTATFEAVRARVAAALADLAAREIGELLESRHAYFRHAAAVQP